MTKAQDMAYKPLRMDQIHKILEYHNKGVPKKKIARLLGLSKNTVKKYIMLMAEQGQEKEKVLSKNQLIARQLHSLDVLRENDITERLPHIISQLGRVGVSRFLLWEEYKRDYVNGYSYCVFCRKIKQYKARQDVTIRLEHKASHTLSIDFTGKKMSWVDRKTGEEHKAEVLVCTMPYSAYTFAIALPSQKQEDFVHGINQALLYMGGLPKIIQSDNLKSFVIKSNRYEPTFNQLCVQLSTYYGVELEAARVAKPKDKASVERHVSIIYNKVYGPLRDTTFYSLEQINAAFIPQLEILNKTNFQGKNHSRHQLFEQDEKPHLSALPTHLFEVSKSTKAKVQRNYHVILGEDKHQYSVPYKYVGKQTEISYNSKQVEVYCGSVRIAIHKRDRRPHAYSTLAMHMPHKHVKYLEQKGWDATYFKKQAEQIGPYTLWAVNTILDSKSLIEQTYKSCLGILKMSKTYTPQRLENACRKAQSTHRVNYGIIKNILQNNMDMAPDKDEKIIFNIPQHDNVRGAQNYY